MQGLFIDECIASIRRSGGHHPVHSGGYLGALRGKYTYQHGVFRCGQCNIILALTDVHEGDGPTMVIPGSHKSNFPHPNAGNYAALDRMDNLDGAVPVYLDKGDAVLFVDGLMHGGSSRTNQASAAQRSFATVSVGRPCYGYEYSQPLLDRLTPERRKILQPSPQSPATEQFVVAMCNEIFTTKAMHFKSAP